MGMVSKLRFNMLWLPALVLIPLMTYALGTQATPLEVSQQAEKLPKTAIEITFPKTGSVWTAPGIVNISWNTRNISPEKTIKFYLSKNDMVVQELGTFKNNGTENNITLAGNLPAGDDYRVVGLELFPDNKLSIAKYATGLFSIVKIPRDAQGQAPPTIRHDFNGRKLTYVKEIEVSGPDIRINLWDHGRRDGDIVSIYLNGKAIVSNYTLQYEKEQLQVSLNPGKPNDLFLYAHNLGKFPPNTVSIEVLDDRTSEKLTLDSDLKSCEAIMIKVGDPKN